MVYDKQKWSNYLLRDLFKVQMDKSPLVKCNVQTINGLYNSEIV